MNQQRRALSVKSEAVLTMIAEGRTYEQILARNGELTYLDIFGAAREALDLARETGKPQARLDTVRKSHPRAYEP